MRTVFAFIVLILMTACATADVNFQSQEPYDSVYPHYDGSPIGYGYPCEIYSLSGTYHNATGVFDFQIKTNFGSKTDRDSAHMWADSYTRNGVGLESFAAGDLYIKVSGGGTYGLLLEGRSGTDSGIFDTMKNAGYTSGTTAYDVTKSAGQLWKYDPNSKTPFGLSGFATGTFEEYVAEIGSSQIVPQMADAEALPALIDLGASGGYDMGNAYPTLLLGGDLADTFSAPTWTTTAAGGLPNWNGGTWTGSFELPESVINKQVQIWWSMECGNDAVRAVSLVTGSEPVPAPPSLILCVVGVACVAVARRFRRK